MITIESRDSQIWNLDKKIIEIIKECVSSNEKIIISTNAEGVCLRSCYFYDLLDNICGTFNIDKSRFEIHTPNIEEFHDEYNIVIIPNVWVDLCKNTQVTTEIKDSNLYTVGCFIGKINWARLSLLWWLDQYPDKAMISCYYNHSDDETDVVSRSSLQLNQNMLNLPDEIESATKFLKTCPRRFDYTPVYRFDEVAARVEVNQAVNVVLKSSEPYAKIFVDLISETYFSGFTFFPTEKTFRPIQQLTPFIVHGPRGFLTNLHRCGFKTFSKYWDEGYDECVGVERILKIREILTQLFKLDQKALHEMYTDMLPILNHNKHRLTSLVAEDLLLDEHRK